MKDKVINFFTNIIIVVSLIFIFTNLFLIFNGNSQRKFVPSVFGYKFLIEASNSMQPELNVGDLIIVKETDSYRINDVISYKDEDDVLVTHRIVDIIDENGNTFYKTKGDNNLTEDLNLVKEESIEGTLVNNIRNLGNYILFLATPAGMLVLVLVVITFFLIGYTVNKFREDAKES